MEDFTESHCNIADMIKDRGIEIMVRIDWNDDRFSFFLAFFFSFFSFLQNQIVKPLNVAERRLLRDASNRQLYSPNLQIAYITTCLLLECGP